jgi:hypothetical protein
MKRFFTVLAAVALAGAIYVATAPGSQTASPTARQFKALKAQVGKLQKEVNVLNSHTNLLAAVMFGCMLHETVGVAQRGDPGGTFGYGYTDGGASLTTALDLSETPTSTLLTLNPDPQLDCASLVGLTGAQRHAALMRFAHRR